MGNQHTNMAGRLVVAFLLCVAVAASGSHAQKNIHSLVDKLSSDLRSFEEGFIKSSSSSSGSSGSSGSKQDTAPHDPKAKQITLTVAHGEKVNPTIQFSGKLVLGGSFFKKDKDTKYEFHFEKQNILNEDDAYHFHKSEAVWGGDGFSVELIGAGRGVDGMVDLKFSYGPGDHTSILRLKWIPKNVQDMVQLSGKHSGEKTAVWEATDASLWGVVDNADTMQVNSGIQVPYMKLVFHSVGQK
eukprot:c25762_g1_i1.p1 GENE.c25762_g1_i1~~c25762_g1_i1.p1  ORF type:complete len:242 (-),score=79.49 c25762_g1_i1:138-863(-)